MSEELTNALIQLFSIFSGQDKDLVSAEEDYVKTLLCHYLADKDVESLLSKYDELKHSETQKRSSNKDQKLTSVKDSVRVLGICNNLNKSLDHKQKVIVIIRLFEIVNLAGNPSDPRIKIIDSVSKIFNIAENEFYNITGFITKTDIQEFFDPSLLLFTPYKNISTESKTIFVKGIDDNIIFLHVKSADMYFFRYHGSREILYNGFPVNSKIIYQFAYGGIIRLPLGKPLCYSEIRKQYSKEEETTPVSFNVRNFSFKTGGISFRDINISEKEGSITGIFCETGIANSELLKLLYGNQKPDQGEILINNINLHEGKKKLHGIISYLPEEDLLFEDLTVYENLRYNARLCLKGITGKEINALIEDLLTGLDILDLKDIIAGNQADTGKITAAQRKKINLALELIREPSILFIDKPDPGTGYLEYDNVIDTLCELAQKGMMVFAGIDHITPYIFRTFDKLMFLDKNGNIICYGKPEDIKEYLRNTGVISRPLPDECESCSSFNPDVITRVINAETIDDEGRRTGRKKITAKQWDNYFRDSYDPVHIEDINVPLQSSLKIPSWFAQFTIFLGNTFRLKTAKYKHLLFNILEAPVLAFILAFLLRYISNADSEYIFRENENIPLFFIVSVLISLILGINITADQIFCDRKRLRRNKLLKISRSGYLLSTIIVLLILGALQSILYVLAGLPVLNIRGMMFEFWFAMFTTNAFAVILGLNVSSAFNSIRGIIVTNIIIVILQILFSGAVLDLSKLNRSVSSVDKVPMIAELMASKWAYEGLMVYQYKNNDIQKELYNIEKRISIANYMQVYYIPELLKRVDQCLYDIRRKDTIKGSLDRNFRIIKNEIIIEQENTGLPFKMIERLEKGSFNNMIGFHTKDYLKKLDSYYGIMYLNATRDKDDIINKYLEKDLGLYQSGIDKYTNDRITEIVRNGKEKKKIMVFRDRLVQVVDPVYRDPRVSGGMNIRAHLFAPQKHILGNLYNTFWFNMVVIWIMAALLYIILYFDLPKIIVAFFRKKFIYL